MNLEMETNSANQCGQDTGDGRHVAQQPSRPFPEGMTIIYNRYAVVLSHVNSYPKQYSDIA